jgi:hypothetical protein
METATVGRATTEATIESLKDLWDVEKGTLQADQVRAITVPDAFVDPSAKLLSVPTSLIAKLGLSRTGSRRMRSSTGVSEAAMYDAVRLTIRGRTCTMDVIEVPDGVPVLIGQIPLEHLDFVVDPSSCSLIGNPRHGGEHIYEIY